MPRIILAVLLGYAFIGVLIFGTDQLYAHLIPGVASRTPPDSYYLLAMATDTLFSLAGGWLCGVIARRDSQAVWGLVLVGEVMGVASTIYLWNLAPHYYSFFLLFSYPPAVWFGAKLAKPSRAPRNDIRSTEG